MKITYLVNKLQNDGSIELTDVSYSEWRAIVEKNKGLPAEQQRYFVLDYIPDEGDMDKMVIEVPLDKYREWHREHMACKRNRDLGKTYQHLSLEVIAEIEDVQANFADTDPAIDNAFEKFRSKMLLESLRKALAEWKPWAIDLLDLYMLGHRKDCTGIIAKKYGVSSRMVRKYKRQFEEFVKNFFD